jgi:hypothetical protein
MMWLEDGTNQAKALPMPIHSAWRKRLCPVTSRLAAAMHLSSGKRLGKDAPFHKGRLAGRARSIPGGTPGAFQPRGSPDLLPPPRRSAPRLLPPVPRPLGKGWERDRPSPKPGLPGAPRRVWFHQALSSSLSRGGRLGRGTPLHKARLAGRSSSISSSSAKSTARSYASIA